MSVPEDHRKSTKRGKRWRDCARHRAFRK